MKVKMYILFDHISYFLGVIYSCAAQIVVMDQICRGWRLLHRRGNRRDMISSLKKLDYRINKCYFNKFVFNKICPCHKNNLQG